MERKDAEPIGEIIAKLLKDQNLETKINETRVIKAWGSIFGNTVASYTTGLSIKNKILYVKLSSSVLRNELSMSRNILIERLNNHVGCEVITNIIFK
ncbi:DUF721 domain-containing protein [Coprobacter tertius]|uniref:DUF721 domain-containing protein n=1 Tax=Coprobacter tertius TaxID=2944915 RepID=A0ABT1MDQ0_9BACT|nr:DUF721 domain-containing protein [Coprobacter tertius]MCP9610757.1 DUF721 domain-containing protein [Coprobacter tertius]